MKSPAVILFVLFFVSAQGASLQKGELVQEIVFANESAYWIESPRKTNFGEWGEEEFCPEGYFVAGFRVKVQQDQGFLIDDTALNAIELDCLSTAPASSKAPVPIKSKEGPQGNWGTVFECPQSPSIAFAAGFELRSEELAFDNTAANNFRLICGDGSIVEGNGLSWGDWTGELRCPTGMRVCGLRTQVQDPKPLPNDNTGLNNVDLACCDL